MAGGRIVETGGHNELLANRGLYYDLYKAQFEHAFSMDNPFEEDATKEKAEAGELRSHLSLALAN